MKYLIVGDGYLGNRLANALPDIKHHKGRIESEEEAKRILREYKPSFLINAAGKSGKPNVDWCEGENRDPTIFGNAMVPLMIARACKNAGAKMIHLGSGCFYLGDNQGKGYSEDDPSNYSGSAYSRIRLASEMLLKEYDNVLQLRVRIPLDSVPHPRNLINKLLSYDKIIVEPNSITIIPDFIKTLDQLADLNQTGVFNIVTDGAITHAEILDIYEEISGKKHNYTPLDAIGLSKITKTGRANCTLSTEKLKSVGIKVRDTKVAVRECLEEFVKLTK